MRTLSALKCFAWIDPPFRKSGLGVDSAGWVVRVALRRGPNRPRSGQLASVPVTTQTPDLFFAAAGACLVAAGASYLSQGGGSVNHRSSIVKAK